MPIWLKHKTANGGWSCWRCVRMAVITITWGVRHFSYLCVGRMTWPIVSPGTGRVEFEYPAPNLPEQFGKHIQHVMISTIQHLHIIGIFFAHLVMSFIQLTERPGFLRLRLRPQHLCEQSNPSFVGRRQQHINFTAQTEFEFTPQADECAGLVLIQNNDFHFRFVVTTKAKTSHSPHQALIWKR